MPNSNAWTLNRKCAVRLVQNYESLNYFVGLSPFVVKALETIYCVPYFIDVNILLKRLLDSVTNVNYWNNNKI